nr:hypothetical protein CFP56_39005 [Quercus suber]
MMSWLSAENAPGFRGPNVNDNSSLRASFHWEMSVLRSYASPRRCSHLHRNLLLAKDQQRWQSTATAPVSSRFLSEVKQRLGHCITFGLQPAQTVEAGRILEEISQDWRELIAGSQGFLTGANRRGLFRQEVVWGEQDAMSSSLYVACNIFSAGCARLTRLGKRQPMKWPDCITVYHKLRTEPGSTTDSFILDVLILSELHQRPAARCVEDIVVYDYISGKKTHLKPFMTDVFNQTWKLQEEAKHTWRAKAADLLQRVTRLEQESWNREGAVEDMGGP